MVFLGALCRVHEKGGGERGGMRLTLDLLDIGTMTQN